MRFSFPHPPIHPSDCIFINKSYFLFYDRLYALFIIFLFVWYLFYYAHILCSHRLYCYLFFFCNVLHFNWVIFCILFKIKKHSLGLSQCLYIYICCCSLTDAKNLFYLSTYSSQASEYCRNLMNIQEWCLFLNK